MTDTRLQMVRILAIADEVDESLGPETLRALRPNLIVSCGDLPFDYLEYLVTLANVPLLYVPGNHDPRVMRPTAPALPSPFLGVQSALYSTSTVPGHDLWDEGRRAGPAGCVSIDSRVMQVEGLRVAGLGGSHRYSDGPNQYTQGQMRSRALRLALRARLRHPTAGIDVLVTHAPPFGLGDEPDRCHQGFASFHPLVERVSPKLLVHGHVHPYGEIRSDRVIGSTRVVNAIPRRLLELEP